MTQATEISIGQTLASIPSTALTARDRLQAIVSKGVEHAAPTIERILASTPTDRIVRATSLEEARRWIEVIATTDVIDGAAPSRRATEVTPLSVMPHGTM